MVSSHGYGQRLVRPMKTKAQHFLRKGVFILCAYTLAWANRKVCPQQGFTLSLKVTMQYPFSGVSSFPTIRWLAIGENTEDMKVDLTYLTLVAGTDGKRRRYRDLVYCYQE